MSRHGYNDDLDDMWDHICWRGRVVKATQSKRGQRLLLDMFHALEAMPDKRLVAGELVQADGAVCALGAVAKYRGCLSAIATLDPEDSEGVAGAFDIAEPLAKEITYMNDEEFGNAPFQPGVITTGDDPERRWRQMRQWCINNLLPVDIVEIES